MSVTCDKDSRPNLDHKSIEQPGNIPKSRTVILLCHVHLFTEDTWSNCNNSTSILSPGLKIKSNHLSIMKNVSVWMADGVEIAIYSCYNCGKDETNWVSVVN